MAKIGIDCDGVLADFGGAYRATAELMFPGVMEDREPTHWDDFRGLTSQQDKEVWKLIRATPNFWTTLQPYIDSLDAIRYFLASESGHDVYIVTSRAETVGASIALQTKAWLGSWDICPYNNYLGIIASAHWDGKRKIYDGAQIRYSVDDKGETILDCEHLEGHKAFLLDRPWNKAFDAEKRIYSLQEFFDAVVDTPSKLR